MAGTAGETRPRTGFGPATMTFAERSRRAQSMRVSMETYQGMTQEQKEDRASLVGLHIYGRGTVEGEPATSQAAGGSGYDWYDPGNGGGGGYTLTFAQTEAGQRLAGKYLLTQEKQEWAHRLELEDVAHELATELLPPGDVNVALKQIRRGNIVKSKMAFQAAMEALADRQDVELRLQELEDRRQMEMETLRQARANITVDLIGVDIGRALLFALSGAEGTSE